MSQQFYIKKLRRTQKDLNQIVRVERPVKTAPPLQDIKSAFAHISILYVKYITIYQGLKECYDHMVHPQKRELIARCLDGVAGRIVELRECLCRLDMSEYSYLGWACHDLKLSLPELEMSLSKSSMLERVVCIRKRVQMLEYILTTVETSRSSRRQSAIEEDVYTIQEAVLLIQKNERCFQARNKSKWCKKRRRTRKTETDIVDLELVNEKGILRFQSIWRGHRDRKRIASLRAQMDISLGMMMPPSQGANFTVIDTAEISNRFKEASHNDDIYKKDMILATERVMEERVPGMARDMKQEILQWALECRSITNEWPELPPEEDGGSKFLFANRDIAEVEEEMEELQLELEKGVPAKKAPAQKKDDKKSAAKKKKPDIIEEFVMAPSQFIEETLVPCVQDYHLKWSSKNEKKNRKQGYDLNYLLEGVETNVRESIRAEVDEMMRVELERLKMAIDKQKTKKDKKGKKKGKDKGAKKNKKDKKKKKMKDLTPNVPKEDLFRELVVTGIIQKVPDIQLNDFIGSNNLTSPTDCPGMECQPDLGDIRKMIFDFAILPMSTRTVHELAPCSKSLLLVGPRLSGKKMLVHAVCHELGASLFDLSADNLVDKYEGKKGQAMLMHLVMKVAKEMEPSVIYVGNCDRMFTKKLPPDVAEMKPARMKAELSKAIKFIGPEDRILLIGTSRYPFKAAMKPMMTMFPRLVYLPPPTHSSRCLLWEQMIKNHRGVINDNFNITSLAKVSQGYTAGCIESAVTEVLTEKRKSKQHIYPLRCMEFVQRLALYDPVYREELDAFKEWLTKTPLARKRKLMEEMENDPKNKFPIIGLI